MDRETHRAYVDAGMMPLADYVKQYGDDQSELPFTPKQGTVAWLIAQLSKFDPDSEVGTYNDYFESFNPIEEVSQKLMVVYPDGSNGETNHPASTANGKNCFNIIVL